MNKETAALRKEIIEGAGDLSLSFGFSRYVGQIYTLLCFSDEPLSFNEIVKILKMSNGNASMNLRELLRLGAVKKIYTPGSRQAFYEAEKDILSVAKFHFGLAIKRRLSMADGMIKKVEVYLKTIKQNSSSGKNKKNFLSIEQRINRIKEDYEVVNEIMKNIIK